MLFLGSSEDEDAGNFLGYVAGFLVEGPGKYFIIIADTSC
jgi:hypothetical protein